LTKLWPLLRAMAIVTANDNPMLSGDGTVKTH